MPTVWLDGAPRHRFLVGVVLVAVAGVLAVVGSFLPWAVPGTAPDMDSTQTGWQLFDRYGFYASVHDPTRGYAYYRGGFTGPACVVAGVVLLGCAGVLVWRRADGLPLAVLVGVGVVWLLACIVLFLAFEASVTANYDAQPNFDRAGDGAIMLGFASVLGAAGGVVAVWPRRTARDAW